MSEQIGAIFIFAGLVVLAAGLLWASLRCLGVVLRRRSGGGCSCHSLSPAGVGARFHKGFVDAIAEVWEPLAAAVEAELKANDRPLWITGHSLGGALALLAAWLLKRRFVLVHEVCTFGAPMIGNREACAAFDREFAGRIFRYVNGRDPVPKLPTLSLVVLVRRGPRRYGSDSMRRSGVLKAICRCGFSSYNRFKRAFELTV